MRNTRLALNLTSVALYFLSIWLIASVLARYSRDLGIGLAEVSVIWSSISLVTLVLRPFTGYLADRWSSNAAMSIGAAFSCASSLIYLVARDFNTLLLGRVIQGLGNSFFIAPSAVAVASSSVYIGMALGMRSMLVSLGGVIGPPLAGILVDYVGYAPVFILSTALGMVIVVINLGLKGERSDRADVSWRHAINWTVAATMLLASLGGAVLMTLLGLVQVHYRDLGYEASVFGYLSIFFAVSGLVSRYLAGRLAEEVGPLKVIAVGYLISSVSMVMFSRMYLPPWSFLAVVVYGFGLGLTVPTQQLIAISSVPPGAKNRAMSFYAMGADVGRFLGPLALGYVASIRGYVASYQLMILLPLAALPVLSFMYLRAERGHLW